MKRIYPYLLSSAAYVAGIGLTVTSAWLITMASFKPPLMTLGVAIVGVRFFGISRSVARYFERITSHRQVFDRLSGLRVKLFDAITSNPLSLVRDLSSGKLVKRVVDDVERVQEYELRITLPHIAGVITLVSAVGLGVWILPLSMAVTLPATLFLLFFLPVFIKTRCEVFARRIELLENEYASVVQQASHGIAEAQFYGYLEERFARTRELENHLRDAEDSLLRANRLFAFASTATIGFTLVILAWLAQQYSSTIPAVRVAMLIFLPLVMFESVTMWYPNLFGAGKLLLARAEVSQIINSQSHPRDTFVEADLPITEIEVRNLQSRWNDGEHFMEPVSFTVCAGQTLIIRGRSGSGKSTLAMALLGLLDYDGEIFLNGIEMRSLESSHIAGAIQNSHIFNTSLRENLKIAAPAATDEELVEVIKLVELDTLLEQLPSGLDTVLGQFGRTLSGGEAKRLSLARALLSRADVLVLDEPTEHLDRELSLRIERRILDLHRILIVITHSGWESVGETYQLRR